MSIQVVLTSDHWDSPVQLGPGQSLQIGRDATLVDRVLPVSGVSGRHCELVCQADRLIVRDLGSTNGSFLNGMWISEARAHTEDLLGLGPKAVIKIQINDAGAPAACFACAAPLSEALVARGGRYRDPDGIYCLSCASEGAGQFKIFGHFRLLRQVGGGMAGRVFEAFDLRADARVALKLLWAMPGDQRASRREARFQREIAVLRKLPHPAIVCYHDSGEIDRQSFLAMEFIVGADVGQLLEAQDAPFSPEQVTPIVRATTAALTFAHQHDVIHRDIKPGNILIDQQDNVKLTDFGLALTVDSGSALTDGRADIYGLAATIFYLLTGRRPYQARNDLQLIDNILDNPTPRLKDHRPELLEIDALLAAAMAKDPDQRPQTPAAFAERWPG